MEFRRNDTDSVLRFLSPRISCWWATRAHVLSHPCTSRRRDGGAAPHTSPRAAQRLSLQEGLAVSSRVPPPPSSRTHEPPPCTLALRGSLNRMSHLPRLLTQAAFIANEG